MSVSARYWSKPDAGADLIKCRTVSFGRGRPCRSARNVRRTPESCGGRYSNLAPLVRIRSAPLGARTAHQAGARRRLGARIVSDALRTFPVGSSQSRPYVRGLKVMAARPAACP